MVRHRRRLVFASPASRSCRALGWFLRRAPPQLYGVPRLGRTCGRFYAPTRVYPALETPARVMDAPVSDASGKPDTFMQDFRIASWRGAAELSPPAPSPARPAYLIQLNNKFGKISMVFLCFEIAASPYPSWPLSLFNPEQFVKACVTQRLPPDHMAQCSIFIASTTTFAIGVAHNVV